MKNVLHIFGLMDKGGAELRTIEICKALKSEYKFHFLTLSNKEGSLEDEMLENGFKIFKSKNNLDFFIQLRKVIKDEKINIVHSHIFLASGLVMFISRLMGVEIRISHLRSTGNGMEGKLINDIKNLILKKVMIINSTLIVGVSNGVLEQIFRKEYKINNEKFKVIYNGFSIPAELLNIDNNKEENYNIIHIGRQNIAKNQVRLISIFNEFYKRNQMYKLILIGRKNPHINNKLIDQIEKFSLERAVTILEEKDNIFPYLLNSKALLFPSVREGLPGVVVEALISNIPVLGSNISGILELQKKFPSHIYTVSLNKTDIEWAIKLEELLNHSINRIDFTETVFYIDYSLKQFREIWK